MGEIISYSLSLYVSLVLSADRDRATFNRAAGRDLHDAKRFKIALLLSVAGEKFAPLR